MPAVLNIFFLRICYSFTMSTKTKSGQLIGTPGKFSACVSGQQKSHKSKKNDISALMDTTFETAFVQEKCDDDITNSSLVVNTSQTVLESTVDDCSTNYTEVDNMLQTSVDNDSTFQDIDNDELTGSVVTIDLFFIF